MSDEQYISSHLAPEAPCEPRAFVGAAQDLVLPKASRHNPIKQGFQEALRSLEMLEGRISDVIERLAPVCTKVPAADGPATKNETAGSSDVYNGLRQIDERIRRATTRLAYLLESLEV